MLSAALLPRYADPKVAGLLFVCAFCQLNMII